jgi:hypothetical protein
MVSLGTGNLSLNGDTLEIFNSPRNVFNAVNDRAYTVDADSTINVLSGVTAAACRRPRT